MEEIDVIGQIVGGKNAKIFLRERSGVRIELGDLLVVEDKSGLLIMQVYDLSYGSQVPPQVRELLAGLKLEGYGRELTFLEPELRNYVIAEVKAVAEVDGQKVKIPKVLPPFFSAVRRVKESDLSFLAKPKNPIYLGKVRSGSKVLGVDVFLNGLEAFTHHIIVPATTGRGKSNLVKVMLWSLLDQPSFGILVLDPHDEYYGRHGKGLKDHPKANENLLYYSPNPPVGGNTLVINLRSINPWHFQGITSFTDAQWDAIRKYFNSFHDRWIENIVRGNLIEGIDERTIKVLQRRFDNILGVYLDDQGNLQCRSKVFSETVGLTTIQDIVKALEAGKKVVIDSSNLLDEAELLIGSIIINGIFSKYQLYKSEGKLEEKPVIGIVIEEAPRVLGADVLSNMGDNIYSTIAREGRKFKIGLLAVTQLISLIPKQILANMNTKIILGNELATERRAIIESAAQDLSEDDRTIASLDKGEAIVSSSFTKFAIPIQVPLFENYIKNFAIKEKDKPVFVG
jgi:DNA helicase HerA-like ATPase